MNMNRETSPGNRILRRCVFFDRDGIVNQSPGPGYVERVEDFHVLPEFLQSLRVCMDKGYVAIIITNQRGVGLGLMTEDTLNAIHNRLRDIVQQAGLQLLDIYSCTATENSDPMRKPNPGMILQAAEDHGIDLAHSWMIGDNEKDIIAGHRAGCRTILVSPRSSPESASDTVIRVMQDLPACLNRCL